MSARSVGSAGRSLANRIGIKGGRTSLDGGCGILVLRRKIRSCDLGELIGLLGLNVMALFGGDVFSREG